MKSLAQCGDGMQAHVTRRARNREQSGDQPRGGARGFSGWRAAGSRAADGLRSTSTTSSGTAATTTGETSATGGGDTVPGHITQCEDLVLDWGTPGTAGSVAPVSTRQIFANAVGSTACRTTASAGKAIANSNASKAVPAMNRRWANNRMEPDVTRSRRTASNTRDAARPFEPRLCSGLEPEHDGYAHPVFNVHGSTPRRNETPVAYRL